MSSSTENNSTCFQRLIALKGGCSSYDPILDLYSDDIDITKDFINEIITRQFSGASDFFEKKIDFAIKQVVNQVVTYMTPNFRQATLLDNYRCGIYQDNLSLIAGDGNLKGLNFDLHNSNSFLNLFVSELSLQLNHTGEVEVLVYDLIQNKLIDTITVSCVANEISRVYPGKIYKSSRQKLNLFFCYDSTGKDSNTTYLRKEYCATCPGSKGVNNPYEIINAAKLDPALDKLKKNLKYLGETGGMSIVHSLSCNHENWICSYVNLLGLPILYKYGELVMEFALNVSDNDRTNTSVSLNKEELKSRLDIYRENFKESFSNVINNIKTPSDTQCFVCREPIRHALNI